MTFATVRTCLLLALALAAPPACGARSNRVTVPPVTTGGCPVVLLTRNGGLGFESQSGLIAALWPSGVIVRGPSAAGTLPGHYIGTLTDADLASLMDMVQSPKVWDHPRGEVVLDMPDDTLTLRRNTDVRQWEETPGFTTNPVVGEFRSRLFAVPVQDARRVSAPVDELLTCAAAK